MTTTNETNAPTRNGKLLDTCSEKARKRASSDMRCAARKLDAVDSLQVLQKVAEASGDAAAAAAIASALESLGSLGR